MARLLDDEEAAGAVAGVGDVDGRGHGRRERREGERGRPAEGRDVRQVPDRARRRAAEPAPPVGGARAVRQKISDALIEMIESDGPGVGSEGERGRANGPP